MTPLRPPRPNARRCFVPTPPARSGGRPAARRPSGRRLLALALGTTLGAFLLAALPAVADDDVEVRTIDQDLPAVGVNRVLFHGAVGEVDVVGTDDDAVRLHVVFECDHDTARCRQAAERVDLEVRHRGDELKLELENWPKHGHHGLEVEARLEVPRDRSVELDWGVGELDVKGMEDDVELDLGVGEVTVEGSEATVGSVSIDTGVGEVELRAGGRRIEGHGFIGQSLDWSDGPGDAHIEIDNGVGEILVKLD